MRGCIPKIDRSTHKHTVVAQIEVAGLMVANVGDSVSTDPVH